MPRATLAAVSIEYAIHAREACRLAQFVEKFAKFHNYVIAEFISSGNFKRNDQSQDRRYCWKTLTAVRRKNIYVNYINEKFFEKLYKDEFR